MFRTAVPLERVRSARLMSLCLWAWEAHSMGDAWLVNRMDR